MHTNTTHSGVDTAAELAAQNQRIAENTINHEPIDPEIVAANLESSEQESTPENTGPRPESERERVIREIAERRMAEMGKNEGDFTEQAGNQPGIEERFIDDSAPDMVRIKVDGVERMVPNSEVLEHGIRALQKESAADKRLKEASEMRQAADAREAQLNQFARELQAQQELNKGHALSKADAVDLKQQARSFMEQFMAGNEEAAVESLAAMMGRGNATPDPRAMIEQATMAARQEFSRAETARLQRESDAAHSKAKDTFSSTFKEIMADPMLYRMADQETVQVLADHPEWDASRDIDKILMEAGQRVRNWRGGNPETSKQEIKRSLNKPLISSSGRMPGAPAIQPKSTAQVIADQRRARGLPVY